MNDILVIGDSCKDIFAYCQCTRLSPEAPVPVVDVQYYEDNGGMAKNVESNIKKLGVCCDIITNTNWESITKTRYIDTETNHMFIRVDSRAVSSTIDVQNVNLNYKIIVISDYDKGFLTDSDIMSIAKKHPCVFMDTKKIIGKWASGVKFIKINHKEYTRCVNTVSDDIRDKIIHTAGSKGCFYMDKQYPVKHVDVKDVSGAGDTFLAGLVVRYLQTGNITQSIKFANKCSTSAVQKRGVS